MKSTIEADNEIEAVAAPEMNGQLGRVRIRERHGNNELEKCSIFLTPDQLEEHAQICLALAARIRSHR